MTRDARKRSRSEAASTEPAVEAESSGSKKSKGRPRVVKQDESAADRRRTQIRLAQRAYRQRKENTISNLQEQVTSLQATIDSLNDEFRKLHQSLLNSPSFVTRSELVQELHAASDRFALFVKASQIAQSASEGESERDSAHEELPTPPLRSSRSAAGAEVQLPLGYLHVYDDDSSRAPGGGSTTPPELLSTESSSAAAAAAAAAASTLPSTKRSTGAGKSAAKSGPADAAIRSPLIIEDPRYVFSSEESTFARRLHRAGLEKAYHLLGRSSAMPKLYHKTFQLSLLTDSREQLIQKAKYALTKSVTDPIDFYRMPFFHLGGAGTHYGQNPKTNAYIVKRDQDSKVAKIYAVNDDSYSATDVELDFDDVDTVLFDPADVEGWLASLGITISPRENFTEVEVPEVSPLAEWLRSHGQIPPRPEKHVQSSLIEPQASNQANLQQAMLPAVPMPPSVDLGFGDIGALGSMTYANDATSWLMGAGDRMPDLMAPGWNQYQYTDFWNPVSDPVAPAIRKITIDISHFLNTAIHGGVCLGRSPGFQRKNVEQALLTSIIEVA